MSTTWSTGFLNETEASGSALAMDLQAADAYVSRAFSLPPRPLPIHLSELILWSPTEVGHLTLWPRQVRIRFDFSDFFSKRGFFSLLSSTSPVPCPHRRASSRPRARHCQTSAGWM